MENKENRSLIDKKAYEDQFVTFFLFSFGALSLFSLSHTLGHRVFLEHSSFGARQGKASKGRTMKRKERKELDQANSVGILAGNTLHV